MGCVTTIVTRDRAALAPERDSLLRVGNECPRREDGRALSTYAMCAPTVSTYTAYSDWLAVMKSRLRRGPPKHTLAHVSGSRIIPMRSPAGVITCTPGLAPAQMLPSASQRIPSAADGVPVPGISS